MDEVSIENARRTLGDLVDRATLAERPTVITRHGHRAAVIVSARAFDAVIAHIEYVKDDGDIRSGVRFLKLLLEQCRQWETLDRHDPDTAPESEKDR